MHDLDKTVLPLIEGTVDTALDFWLHSLAEAHASGDKQLEESIRESLKLFAPRLKALYALAATPL